ncbi:DUF2007 domain-containing protein [Phragmitibacter flavus]|uniref:DUF2007 domain-containing protein n=1 Tax=Phragmitibacter flavus TaxID=2576071 RepID=A0A5R8KE57_9BACT|nr:DUF2007 domain-containing protein [Phragmitibacter flavus]TLD70594.1 DUF2007 domain-containing protein [Phragmitibacter flavus]
MKQVFTDRDYTRVGFLKSVLEGAGIACYIQNEHTNSMMAHSLLPMFYPKLCVLNDEDVPAALELVRGFVGDSRVVADEWQCVKCGESVPGEFGSCWKCETLRDEEVAG